MTKTERQIDFRSVLIVFFISRIALEIVGILSAFYFPPAQAIFKIRDLQYHAVQARPLEMWARWDSEWYLLIADHGYASYEYFKDAGGGRYLQQDSAKFFPAYPIAIRTLTFITGNSVLAGILISNTCALLLVYFFLRLAAKFMSAENTVNAAVLYVVFPTSLFLSAVYAESMFLAAIIAAFLFIEERKLWFAVIACAIAVLTRPQGALALPALVWLAWLRFEKSRMISTVVIVAAVCIPLAGYLMYIDKTFGSMSWISQSQTYWRGEMKYPFYAFVRFFQNNIAIHGQHNSIIDFTFAIIQIIVLVFSFRRIPLPYVLYSVIALLFPLSSSLFSFSRLCLANFPFFLVLPPLLGRFNLAIQIFCAILLAFFMAAFANWFWVA
jgi:Gpi18-like mannosyltransferase